MTLKERYEYARAKYAELGVDTDKAIETLKKCPGFSSLLAGRRCKRI